MSKNFEVIALHYLRKGTGFPNAAFRDGQLEAIDALVNKKSRLLMVRRTGWGKSIVYFIATMLLRKQGKGPTLIISPLLALMRNQLEASRRIGLISERIDSSNDHEWDQIYADIKEDKVDVLLIAPERLSNAKFRDEISETLFQRLGLLVIDEAHCISDWGHDFRPHYRLISNFVYYLPKNIAMIATTATADDTVVKDVQEQLGDTVIVSRGPLTRKSLYLDVITNMDYTERLAWVAKVLPQLPGSGIIYTLTKRDANLLSEWLGKNNINAPPYHTGVESENREEREYALINDEIKALVATTALSMGFDKPNLGFVIHFQGTQSIIHYYQQVGRAGRAIEKSYGILLTGDEDDDIIDFFIRNALPPQELVNDILRVLENNNEGLSIPGLMSVVNKTQQRIKNAIQFLELENPSPITKIGSRYYRTAIPYNYPVDKARKLADRRREERTNIIEYSLGKDCLMKVLAHALGDVHCDKCNRCSVCLNKHHFNIQDKTALIVEAEDFLNSRQIKLLPRKKWLAGGLPIYGFRPYTTIEPELCAEEGRSLAYFQMGKIGRKLRIEKYELNHFSDETVEQAAELIRLWKMDPEPKWVIPMVSDRRPNLVPSFSRRLAKALGCRYVEALKKTRKTEQQKGMENASFRVRNLDGSLEIIPFEGMDQPGLFIDDMYDSGWTVTVAIALLRRAGSGVVFPFTLSKVSDKE